MTQAVILGIVLALGSIVQANADPLPTKVGECSQTAISRIGTRLEDGVTGAPVPGSGTAVQFANGGAQVSYATVHAITSSRVADPVRLCLVIIPSGCPPGDDRGRVYRATNLRTHQSWQLPDAEHSCGGA